MNRTLLRALRGAAGAMCVAAIAAVFAACSPSNDSAILAALRSQLDHQYHECVPLGWNPVPAAGTYVPGASVELREEEVWLRPRWLARVPARSLRRPEVRAISEVLDALVRHGMLDQTRGYRGVGYRLTEKSLRYYFDDSQYGNNPDHLPYLCYSTIVAERVLSSEAIRGSEFSASFEWNAGPAAAWANDPVIRSHSVLLGPTHSPVAAKLVKNGRDWQVTDLDKSDLSLPQVVDASVWPRLQP